MSATELFFLVAQVLGGLALFIFGMNIMTDGLRQAVGGKLRTILAATTSNRFAGIGFGTVLGTLVHSSGTTVMLVGFVNAGLMTLAQAIPPVLGANIGTTVSMQLISFKLSDYCFAVIAIGFMLTMFGRNQQVKESGKALIGFGLLFLGMETMSGALKPHREALRPLLQPIDGTTWPGLFLGVGIALGITSIIQSSGATIGMAFALIDAGAFTSFPQVFPIVLGAHIGTCATALLGSIGTNIFARRTALSHLLFNIFNVSLAIAMRPLYFRFIELTSDDLKRQTANMHTLVMLITVLVLVPFIPFLHKIVEWISPTRKPLPEPTHLDPDLIPVPEKGIVAVLKELARMAKICQDSFLRLDKIILLEPNKKELDRIKKNEAAVNDIKLAIKDYVNHLTEPYLSQRQAFLLQYMDRCASDIERIGDHVETLCEISLARRAKGGKGVFDQPSLESLFHALEKSREVLRLVIESLDPKNQDFDQWAERILASRDEYMELSQHARELMAENISNHSIHPAAGVYYNSYMTTLDRIVRHTKIIAITESQPEFKIKKKKLKKESQKTHEYEEPSLVNIDLFLDRLQNGESKKPPEEEG